MYLAASIRRFATQQGGSVEARNVVNRFFKPLPVRTGLPRIRFHDLRHRCLFLLVQRSEPIRDLQALAGHATAAFTTKGIMRLLGEPFSACSMRR